MITHYGKIQTCVILDTFGYLEMKSGYWIQFLTFFLVLSNAKWIQNDPVQNGYTSKVSRFFVGNGSTNGSGCLRGLLRLIKTHFENIFGRPF